MSKYNKLWKYISEGKKETNIISFDQIEKIIGFPIDHSFLLYKKELLEFGFKVKKISKTQKNIIFIKIDK